MSEEVFDCTTDNIEAADDACTFAKAYCSSKSLFDFYNLHYCNFYGDGFGLELVGVLIYLLLIAL